jgi:cell division septal protein FtsQ
VADTYKLSCMDNINNNNVQENNFKKKRRHKWQILCLILIVMVIALFANRWRNNQSIQRIDFIGNRLIPTQELSKKLSEALGDSTVGKYSLNKIEKNIEEHPYVEKTIALHKDVNVIKIEVHERIPSAIIVDNEGNLAFANDSGKILPYRMFKDINDLPVISGIYNGTKLDTFRFHGCISILRKLEEDNFVLLSKLISDIVFNTDNRYYELRTAEGGVRIIVGNLDCLDKKLSKLNVYLNEQFLDDKKTICDYIDLRWKDQIVVK